MIESSRIGRPGGFASSMLQELKKEFRYLSAFSVLVTLSIFCQLGVWIYEVSTCRRYVNAGVKFGIVIIDQIPGVFAAPTLLFQSWRIVAEIEVVHQSDFHQLKTLQSEFETVELPKIASQLLGWDTIDTWRRLVPDGENFPGLFQVKSRDSVDEKNNSNTLRMKIMQTTETTVETFVTRPL